MVVSVRVVDGEVGVVSVGPSEAEEVIEFVEDAGILVAERVDETRESVEIVVVASVTVKGTTVLTKVVEGSLLVLVVDCVR